MDYAALSTPSVWRSAGRSADSDIRFSLASADDFEIPAFLRKQSEDMQPASLKAIAEAVSEHLSHGGRVQGLAAHCEAMDLHADVRLVLDQAVDLGLCIGDAWLLLAHWANRRPGALADSAITEALRPHLDGHRRRPLRPVHEAVRSSSRRVRKRQLDAVPSPAIAAGADPDPAVTDQRQPQPWN